MKTLMTFVLSVFFLIVTHAQAVIVVQNATTSSTHLTFQAALNAAVAGDYIYVPGGNFNLPNGRVVIDKPLHIIGAGHVPDSTRATGPSVLGGNLIINKGAENSVIEGLYISGNIYTGNNCANSDVSKVLISRCNIQNLLLYDFETTNCSSAKELKFRESIIRGNIHCNNTRGHVFENCILADRISSIDGNVSFNHCLFLYRGNDYLMSFVSGCTVSNSILLHNMQNFAYMEKNAPNYFNNCIFGATALSTITNQFLFNQCLAYGDQIKGMFVNIPEYSKFDYTHDYHLVPESAAKGKANDGTDCGIYGGPEPYKEGAVPSNPHIIKKSIPSTTDNQGKLNISVSVSAQNR